VPSPLFFTFVFGFVFVFVKENVCLVFVCFFSSFQTKETDGRTDRENRRRRIKAFQGSTDWLWFWRIEKEDDKADGWMEGVGYKADFFFFFPSLIKLDKVKIAESWPAF
jgi:hypothetical protein